MPNAYPSLAPRTRTAVLLGCLLIPGTGGATAQMTINVFGNGVDIRNVGNSGLDHIYPIGDRFGSFETPGRYHLFDDRSAPIAGRNYATNPIPVGYHKTNSRRDYSLDSFTANEAGKVFLATAFRGDSIEGGWDRIPGVFDTTRGTTQAGNSEGTGNSNFYVYELDYQTPGQSVSIPMPDPFLPSLLIGGEGARLRFANPRPISELSEGATVITQNDRFTITSPSMIVLDNGDYLASTSGGERKDGYTVRTYLSRDKGVSWEDLNENRIDVNRQSPFQHRGDLYMLGDLGEKAAIQKSTDGGRTWSAPSELGIDFRGAPSPILVNDGRIWSAAERGTVISAPEDADLLDPASWTRGSITNSTRGVNGEPVLVATREGGLVVMGKGRNGGIGRGVAVIDKDELRTNRDATFEIPGSGSKYAVAYDEVSDLYWALTSESDVEGEIRTGIALYSSEDLLEFSFEAQVIEGTSNLFDGFNYPFLQFDGDDIVFVSRTAYEDERGLARRWHDGNNLTFHRVSDFRSLALVPEPASLAVFAAGGLGLLTRRRRDASPA